MWILHHPISTFTDARCRYFPHKRVTGGDPPSSGPDANFGFADDFFEISLDIVTERASVVLITAMFGRDRREWLVPPILEPLFLDMIVAGAVIVRW